MTRVVRVHPETIDKFNRLEDFLKKNDISFEVSDPEGVFKLTEDQKQILDERDASATDGLTVTQVNERLNEKYGV